MEEKRKRELRYPRQRNVKLTQGAFDKVNLIRQADRFGELNDKIRAAVEAVIDELYQSLSDAG